MLDLLITNGLVIDGTASPGFHAAVGVKDETVSIHRGDVSELEAARIIDADGHVVCPGFVDLHSHAGLTMLGAPHHDPKVRQGVTTELVGIDGISHAPFKSQDELHRYIWLDSGLNGYPPMPADWLSVADFLGKFDNSVAINVAYILGNSPGAYLVGRVEPEGRDIRRDRRYAGRGARGHGGGSMGTVHRAGLSAWRVRIHR